MALDELTCAHPSHLKRGKINPFKNTSVEAVSLLIASSHSCRHKGLYPLWTKTKTDRYNPSLISLRKRVYSWEMNWAELPEILYWFAWKDGFTQDRFETKLYNKMKFYPFLVIAESQKGWYFFVELSSVNIIWNVPNLNLQKSHKNKAKLWFNILLSF